MDPAVDRHVLLRLTLYKVISDTDSKSTRSIATPKIGSSRSIRLSSASMAGGMNMSRFSKSGLTSRFIDDLPEIDDDLTTVYLVKPARGPRFGDSVGTKTPWSHTTLSWQCSPKRVIPTTLMQALLSSLLSSFTRSLCLA